MVGADSVFGVTGLNLDVLDIKVVVIWSTLVALSSMFAVSSVLVPFKDKSHWHNIIYEERYDVCTILRINKARRFLSSQLCLQQLILILSMTLGSNISNFVGVASCSLIPLYPLLQVPVWRVLRHLMKWSVAHR